MEHEPEKAAAPQAQSSSGGGGGWWGGIFGAASAAVKQAEALAREIQQNEEAQRWAEQVKGNVGALRGLGTPFFFDHPTVSLLFSIQFITTISSLPISISLVTSYDTA